MSLSSELAEFAVDEKIGNGERFLYSQLSNYSGASGALTSNVQAFETCTLARLKASGVPTDALNVLVSLKQFGLLVVNALSQSFVIWYWHWRASLCERERKTFPLLSVASGENVTHVDFIQRTTRALLDAVLHLEFARHEFTKDLMKILNG